MPLVTPQNMLEAAELHQPLATMSHQSLIGTHWRKGLIAVEVLAIELGQAVVSVLGADNTATVPLSTLMTKYTPITR